MLRSKPQAEGKSKKEKVKSVARFFVFAFCLFTFALSACRYDMQDQPRYKALKKSDFFSDGRAMRDLPEGTVSRGNLRENKAFYTGKKENAGAASAPAAAVAPTMDASGNTVVTSFPDDIEEFPVPVSKELVDRGEQRYRVFCIVCHGPVGSGDGMVVRRGYPKPSTYHDDRLRNAPVGHFYDVITNGWGKMNGYAAQIPPADRWAIVAYIRTLQISQNPNGNMSLPTTGVNTGQATSATSATTQTTTVPPTTGH